MRCTRCHRPLRKPTATGMGPVCARTAAPAPVHERDLFGYDVDKAVHAARHRIAVAIEAAVVEARMAVRQAFREARVRAGVWSK